MNYIFNAEKIEKLLSDFYISTGIAVTFYDSDANKVATSAVHSDYCSFIRQECKKECKQSNLTHIKEASQSKKTVSYTCHAGLMETIIPVFYEDTIIGYMQIGQFKDENRFYSSEEKTLETAIKYGFSIETLMEKYANLPIVSDQKLDSLKEILYILIKNFWEDGLIRHNRSMLSVKIEQYINEHLKEKIYVEDICEQFFLSKNALYRIFAEEFGTTIGDYIFAKRTQLAVNMLKDTNYSVMRVAYESGFKDHNYFIRSFKKQMGITPLQFRKSHKRK